MKKLLSFKRLLTTISIIAATAMQAQQPETGAVIVNTTPSPCGVSFDIDMASNGAFVPVWNMLIPGTPVNNISEYVQYIMQRPYNASNVAITATDNYVYNGALSFSGDQYGTVAVKSNGDFLVVYSENIQGSDYLSAGEKIYLQQYHANGTVSGTRIYVDNGETPFISIAPDGTFDIAYTKSMLGYGCTWSNGCTWVMVARYNSSAVSLGASVFAMNKSSLLVYPLVDNGSICLRALNNNAFDVGSGSIISRFNSAGTQVYGDLKMSCYDGPNTYSPSNKNFVVKPNGDIVAVQNNSANNGCSLRRWAYNGNTPLPATDEYLTASNSTTIQQVEPSIGINGNGDYVVIYPKVDGSGNNLGLYAQQYCVNDTKVGPEYPINIGTSYSTINTGYVSIAVSNCDFIVMWEDFSQGLSAAKALYRKFKLYPATIPTSYTTVCSGQSVPFTNSVCSTTTGNTYSWAPVTGLNNHSILNPIASPSSTTIYTLTVTSSVCTFTTPVTVNINPSPVPHIGSDGPICLGSSATLCTDILPSSLYTVDWYVKGHTNSQCLTVSPTVNTTYNVLVTNTSTGCTGMASQLVTVQNINPVFTLNASMTTGNPYYTLQVTNATYVSPSTDPSFGYYWGVEEIAVGSSTPFTAIAGSEVDNSNCWWTEPNAINFPGYQGGNYTYQTNSALPCSANFGAGAYIGTFTPGHEYLITYGTWSSVCPWKATAQTAYHCAGCRFENETVSSDVTYEKAIGLQSKTKEPVVQIYPNPSNGSFMVETIETNPQILQVFDLAGRMVVNQTLNGKAVINATALMDGVYNVKITDNNSVVNKRIVITR